MVAGPSGRSAAACETDLVPGVYEGGLKLWEGALDLVSYLAAAEERPGEEGSVQAEAGPRVPVREEASACGHAI